MYSPQPENQSEMVGDKRGLLAVLGAFLIQLCVGCYHGTFGNLLPYLTSYMRQVRGDIDLRYLSTLTFSLTLTSLTVTWP